MKIFRLVLKIILLILVICLAVVGLRYLIAGGWSQYHDKFAELDKNIWSFIKWFFSFSKT